MQKRFQLTRRTWLLAGAALAANARAQPAAWPDRAVRIVVPYAPGGLGDLFVRRVATQLSAQWGQPVIVENKPGANTIIGAETVARTRPDGYTLLFCSMSTMALNVGTYKKLPDDPVADVAPITLGFYSPLYLLVNSTVPARNVEELVALAKTRKLAYASTGNGGAMHVATERFRLLKGIELDHVPYKGSAPGLQDLLAGQVQVMLDVGAGWLQHARAGRVRVLAVTGPKRTAAAPDVPTFTEAGMTGFDFTVWFGFVAPAGTPAAVTQKVSQDIANVLKAPAFQEAALAGGYELASNTPAQFSSLIREDIEKWTGMVKAAGVVPE